MKLKYYLRGLGVGIVVTAIIMSFTRQPEKLTDAQIKLRALELGMVEESVLADLQKDKEKVFEDERIPLDDVLISGGEALIGENLEMEEGYTKEDVSQMPDETIAENNSETENVPVQEEKSGNEQNNFSANDNKLSDQKEATESNEINMEENSEGNIVNSPVSNLQPNISNSEMIENYIIITVEGGNGSEVVSRKLYEAGLVESEVAYNKYLVDNGYSRILKAGNHEIPVGATEEEMAKILCGMK